MNGPRDLPSRRTGEGVAKADARGAEAEGSDTHRRPRRAAAARRRRSGRGWAAGEAASSPAPPAGRGSGPARLASSNPDSSSALAPPASSSSCRRSPGLSAPAASSSPSGLHLRHGLGQALLTLGEQLPALGSMVAAAPPARPDGSGLPRPAGARAQAGKRAGGRRRDPGASGRRALASRPSAPGAARPRGPCAGAWASWGRAARALSSGRLPGSGAQPCWRRRRRDWKRRRRRRRRRREKEEAEVGTAAGARPEARLQPGMLPSLPSRCAPLSPAREGKLAPKRRPRTQSQLREDKRRSRARQAPRRLGAAPARPAPCAPARLTEAPRPPPAPPGPRPAAATLSLRPPLLSLLPRPAFQEPGRRPEGMGGRVPTSAPSPPGRRGHRARWPPGLRGPGSTRGRVRGVRGRVSSPPPQLSTWPAQAIGDPLQTKPCPRSKRFLI